MEIRKPLLVTDGHYIWLHHMDMKIGPLVAHLTEDGQIAYPEKNAKDPHGVPVNPAGCIGGKIHTVDNPMFPPNDLWTLDEQP